MKTLLYGQLGFIIGNTVIFVFSDFELSIIIHNHVFLTGGHFCKYIQDYLRTPTCESSEGACPECKTHTH